MASIQFKDNSTKVKAELNEKTIAWLYEAAGEICTQTTRNTPTKGTWFSNIKSAWTYKVDESKGEAYVGNPLQAAIWTEFGTGEYAVKGNGRKGYWVYVKGEGNPNAEAKGGKSYSFEEAKKIVAMMRKDGLDAHMTKGQKPHRALNNAFTTLKNPLIRRFQQIMKGIGS